MTVLTREDGLTALGEAEQASRQWGGDTVYWRWLAALPRHRSYNERARTCPAGVSRDALMTVTLEASARASRWVLPLYDGDPPADGVRPREGLLYRDDALGYELVSRALLRPAVRGSGVLRETHRAVHAALTGECSTSHGAPGCPFCR